MTQSPQRAISKHSNSTQSALKDHSRSRARDQSDFVIPSEP